MAEKAERVEKWPDDFKGAPNHCRLWRAIPPQSVHPPDPITGREDPSSSIFRTREMSAFVIDEKTPAAMKRQFPGFRFREFTAGAARENGFIIVRVPEGEDNSHVHVLRADKPGSAPSKGVAAILKEVSRWADA